MTENIIIIIVMFLFLFLLVSGQYISTILLFGGIVGLYLLGGMGRLNGFLQSEPFNQVTSYSLTTIPLYILMAQFIIQAGIIRDFYTLIYKLSRGKSSLLGVLTILLGGFLGAVSGSGTATSAALGQVAVPELQRRGFSDKLAAAIAASSGSLSAIIPPSVILIMYGVITQTSIGRLFAASVIPGILTMLVFIVVTIFLFNKSKTDPTASSGTTTIEEVPVKQYVIIITAGILIVAAIFVGIFSGLFTPTEAGAVGAFISFIVAVLLGKFTMEFIKTSVTETLKVTVMAMSLVIGASIFGRFISLSLIPRKLIGALEPLMEFPMVILILILLLFFFLFMFIEGIAVLLMTLPVVLPIIETLNIDPLWFGVMVSFICTLGFLTPPVGISVYTVGAVTKIPIEKIFRSTFVYALIAFVVVGAIMILFPQTVTWLPSRM
ncbi:TRAP transporter large permease [Psychrobacillus sp. OK032]|uniref:TRAP transporter large permease n=1 Tax=Psychrobacillus sp. OK032 TaxID=1884358 RepID=UPI0008C4AE64|nr:TRAP transporter large permease [Psychrobacillus sp. OK032]SER69939.1 TRAP transporter, DctM subunit [Psychrobacillus sp. OK032]